jgi:diguanylate cyclase (GGDEF)-like protein
LADKIVKGKVADGRRIGAAERDIIALGTAIAAIILFVGTGGSVLSQVVQSLKGLGVPPDRLLVNALLLNIALIIFSWRRHRQLEGEVEERRKAEELARRLAETDALTGCLNRRSLGPSTARLKTEAEARGEIVAVIVIDLDNFKHINDYNGHARGDIILQETAKRIERMLPAGSLLARLGGDEFVGVVAFDPRHSDKIDQLAAGIVDSVAKPVDMGGSAIEVTVSVGITRSDLKRIADPTPPDVPTLMHMADIAMYHAKKQGRNRFFWFESPMENEMRFRNELETGIRRGIERGEFVPYYEQQIDLRSGKLTGFEMLARWNSPTLGMISPEIFIPIAEEIGAIGELSESVIAQALYDARDWDPELSLSVNISPLQLRDPWFAQKLLKMLVEAHFPPSRLEIEITESCLHENVGAVRTLVASLKNQGIRISLDDFGTGYSSLAQLRSLPFDRIKIDRSFVTNMHENTDSASIVAAITALGEGLHLPITAEGIETEDVLKKLQGVGQFKGQGYLYGRPEAADSVRKRLTEMGLLVGGEKRAMPAEATAAEKPRLAGNG